MRDLKAECTSRPRLEATSTARCDGTCDRGLIDLHTGIVDTIPVCASRNRVVQLRAAATTGETEGLKAGASAVQPSARYRTDEWTDVPCAAVNDGRHVPTDPIGTRNYQVACETRVCSNRSIKANSTSHRFAFR